MLKRALPLLLFVALALMAAALGGYATSMSVSTWYPLLKKPSWTPPSSVFAPVWAVLYILMAIATWRVWRIGDASSARGTVSLYSAQRTLNALWSILFFGLQRPGIALLEIIVLWGMLLLILRRYWVADRISAYLWLSYFLWVSFACILNAAIWELNS